MPHFDRPGMLRVSGIQNHVSEPPQKGSVSSDLGSSR